MEHLPPQGASEDAPILGYGARTFPVLAQLDQRAVVETNPEDVAPDVVLSLAMALCYDWSTVEDCVAALAWLSRAIPTLDVEALIDLDDVALASAGLLADGAGVLESAWTVLSKDPSLRGNVALEGRVRLALGGWCEGNLSLRSGLVERVRQAALGAVDVDPFLVRSAAAALHQWQDSELERALEQLAGDEDVECDIALELGMANVRRAVEASDQVAAITALRAARDLFDRASGEGERPDASAFGAACAAVSRFLDGGSVTSEDVRRVRESATAWHRGYLGLPPHWRQARAETAGHWAALMDDLHRVSDLHETTWLSAMQLLADVGRLYVSHNGYQLIGNPGGGPAVLSAADHDDNASAASNGAAPAVALALQPALDAGLAATANSLTLLDRWLESAARGGGDVDPEAVAAIAAARARIRSAPPPSGKVSASRDEWLPPALREALQQVGSPEVYAEIVETLRPHADVIVSAWAQLALDMATTPLTLAEEAVLRDRLARLQELQPAAFASWSPHLNRLLSVLIRVARFAIDREQHGDRTLPWHSQVATGKKPAEHLLADFVVTLLLFDGVVTAPEVRHVGGGRCDVFVVIDRERLVIEVKRVSGPRWSDERLVDEFGTQAAQYQMTGAPFAFLAVLDATPSSARIDLDTTFWVSPWTHELLRSAEPWGLTTMRVLSDVEPPSRAV